MSEKLLTIIPRGKDNGAWSTTIEAGSSVTIPAGYHNGSGKVTANKGSLKVVDLGGINCWGGGGSINVKSKLPSIYSSLTTQNFYVEPVSSWLCYGGMEPNDTGDYRWNFSKSYNASTGILSISQMGATVWAGHAHGGLQSAKAYCVYAE